MKIANLVKYLKNHSIDVIDFNDDTILVESLFSVNGELVTSEETIPANINSVRDYLGY